MDWYIIQYIIYQFLILPVLSICMWWNSIGVTWLVQGIAPQANQLGPISHNQASRFEFSQKDKQTLPWKIWRCFSTNDVMLPCRPNHMGVLLFSINSPRASHFLIALQEYLWIFHHWKLYPTRSCISIQDSYWIVLYFQTWIFSSMIITWIFETFVFPQAPLLARFRKIVAQPLNPLWPSYRIRKIVDSACAGNVFSATEFKGNC